MICGLNFVHRLEPDDAPVEAHLAVEDFADEIAVDVTAGEAGHHKPRWNRLCGVRWHHLRDPFREGDSDRPAILVPAGLGKAGCDRTLRYGVRRRPAAQDG